MNCRDTPRTLLLRLSGRRIRVGGEGGCWPTAAVTPEMKKQPKSHSHTSPQHTTDGDGQRGAEARLSIVVVRGGSRRGVRCLMSADSSRLVECQRGLHLYNNRKKKFLGKTLV